MKSQNLSYLLFAKSFTGCFIFANIKWSQKYCKYIVKITLDTVYLGFKLLITGTDNLNKVTWLYNTCS